MQRTLPADGAGGSNLSVDNGSGTYVDPLSTAGYQRPNRFLCRPALLNLLESPGSRVRGHEPERESALIMGPSGTQEVRLVVKGTGCGAEDKLSC